MLGWATIEAIRKLDRLTKVLFKGGVYKAAGETSAALEGKLPKAEVIASGAREGMATTVGASSVASTG